MNDDRTLRTRLRDSRAESAYDAPILRPTPRTVRVGLLIDRWQPSRGGAERALADLAAFLVDRGHHVDVFAERGPHDGEEAPGKLHLVSAGGIALLRGARERRLAEALVAESSSCDVSVGVRHLPRVDLYWPHGGSHAASVNAIVNARAWRPDRHRARVTAPLCGRHRAFVELERELLTNGGARDVVCVSRTVRDELAASFPAATERLAIVPNGVDLDRFHPHQRAAARTRAEVDLNLARQAPLIVFSARNPRLKGLPVLLAALARLTHRRWNLLVAGTREIASWRSHARAAGIGDDRARIVRECDAATLAAAADLCVLPTWRDTCGLVVLEALACGTPVITTRAAGAADAIRPGAGSVVDRPGDVDALTLAIETWLDRIDAHAIDREAIRACVLDRGRDAWLAALEERIVRLVR